MTTKHDLEYIQTDNLFYSFVPLTKEGEDVWRQMNNTPGMEFGKVFVVQINQVLHDLKKAGYSVRKANKTKDAIDIDEIAAFLES